MKAVVASAIGFAPPKKPRRLAKTIPRPSQIYTIHTNPNHAFTLKLSEETRTSIVGFKEWDDALFIGKMIETYFVREKEWPDTKDASNLTLPVSHLEDDILRHIYIQQWDFDDIKLTCTKNFLDLIGVEGIINKKTVGYTFEGSVYRFEAPFEFYKERFNEIFQLGH